MKDIITIGELLVDLTQTEIDKLGIRRFAANPGGAPANVAVAAARLGASAGFIGKIGADTFGRDLRTVLERDGVDVSGLYETSEALTAEAVVSVNDTGERGFSFYRSPGADELLTEAEALAALKECPRVLHFGSVCLTTEPARSAVLGATRYAHEHGSWISYDSNYRASLWSDEETALRWMREPLGWVDILKLSEEELPLLTGTADPEEGTRLLSEQGVSLILLTLGSEGVFYRCGARTGRVSGVNVRVADTNGAGDTFFGAFLRCLTRRERGALRDLDTDALEEMLDFANHAAALTCSKAGAIPAMPRLEDVEKFRAEHVRLERSAEARLERSYDELRRLFLGLYHGDEQAFDFFLNMLRRSAAERKEPLRELDAQRMSHPDWYRSNKLMGMMLYVDAFAGNLKGVREKLDYLQDCGVNYLHLMPLLKTSETKDKSDGGYAVADFRAVHPPLGTMEDLEALADDCRERGISLALDFVMNHTSEEHVWARSARKGNATDRARYFFYDSWDIPGRYEQTVPQVFPTTAPGNFTWLEDCKQLVMTTFYPYQWDLNYANPMVLNDMTENLLFLANRGMDVIRLDAIPYIWKELGTQCRNLPQVHTLARLLHLACYVVCPGVLLLGEVVMEPSKVAPYFGSPEAPECQMLYNVTTMCTTWHTLATRDVRLLRRQIEQVSALPKHGVFQNYLRCHDDIGWGLDYPWLSAFGIREVSHKRYLNDWFTGNWPGSWARGELYNDDPRLGDARLCGTTASLCGMETDEALGLQCDEMLHAWMLTQSGIPVLYSGDELGQFNDYSYHKNPEKRDDSRYLHRGDFDWAAAEKRHDPATRQGKLFEALRRLEQARASHPAFRTDAQLALLDTGSDQVLGVRRSLAGRAVAAVFNFSEHPHDVLCPAGEFLAASGAESGIEGSIRLEPYGYAWVEMT